MNQNDIALLTRKTNRRRALQKMTFGALGLATLASSASAQIAINSSETTSPYPPLGLTAQDLAVLDFALNLEYLEAQFYSYATTGAGIEMESVSVTGRGTLGTVIVPDSTQVPFSIPAVQAYAEEITRDEIAHVKFLRGAALAAGKTPVAMPTIDLLNSFNTAAAAAGLPTPFTPFDNDDDFLLGAFIFEDVGVTAYHGAITVLRTAAAKMDFSGIMGTEAYHAANIRTLIYALGLGDAANAISAARDSLGGVGLDQGVVVDGQANIVPADANSLVFARTTAQVLNIVYLSPNGTLGGFFPNGINS
jgi:hypothetical protein